MQGATYLLPGHMEAPGTDLHGAGQDAGNPDHHGRQPVCHWAEGGPGTPGGRRRSRHGRTGRSHHR
eukprot:3620273-Prorocentrum_lima.AAC.1